jgi:SAM-dependent methyltransferase
LISVAFPPLHRFARRGEAVAQSVYLPLNAARASAPQGELSQFSALVVANQYRIPYAMSLDLVSRGAAVLDWGCGDGHFSYFLLAEGFRVTSFSLQHRPHVLGDLPPALTQRFRYVQGSLNEPTRLPFEDASFDAIFSVGVLEHVREIGGTELGSLREIRRILRPGGLFLCFHLPNRYSYIEALSRSRARGSADPERHAGHAYRYSARDVVDLCARAGLVPLVTGRYAFFPRNLLARLPATLRDSGSMVTALNRLDDGLARLFNPVCQNHVMIATPQ